MSFFGLSEQSSGRAIALPPASVSALVSAIGLVSEMLQFLG